MNKMFVIGRLWFEFLSKKCSSRNAKSYNLPRNLDMRAQKSDKHLPESCQICRN